MNIIDNNKINNETKNETQDEKAKETIYYDSILNSPMSGCILLHR